MSRWGERHGVTEELRKIPERNVTKTQILRGFYGRTRIRLEIWLIFLVFFHYSYYVTKIRSIFTITSYTESKWQCTRKILTWGLDLSNQVGRHDVTLSVFPVPDVTCQLMDDRGLPRDWYTWVPFIRGTVPDRDIVLFHRVLWKKLFVKCSLSIGNRVIV